ncbi:MAG: hypothetical protein H7X95_05510 [Deltaproteobacteria bacterium]|nr:hypothetical protein [Deltaproteobacteria bacterium]
MENLPQPAHPSVGADILAALDAEERGFVLGMLLRADAQEQEPAPAIDAPVPPIPAAPSAARCDEAIAMVVALPRTERLRVMGVLAREALAPWPPGIENVHHDVLCDVLQAESTAVVRQMAAGGGPNAVRRAAEAELMRRRDGNTTGEPADNDLLLSSATQAALVDLQRAVLVSIVPVPPAPLGTTLHRLGRRLAVLTPSALLTEVTDAGADLLGTSLRGADADALKRAIAHVGAPWSERILEIARQDTDPHAEEDHAAGRARARVLVSATTPAESPRRTLERLGARALGDRLGREDPDQTLAVAQRLPRDLGRELLAGAEAATPSGPHAD